MKKLSPYDLEEKTFVEECQKVSISQLLKEFTHIYKKEFIKSKLAVERLDIKLLTTKAKYGGERVWFACPICNRRSSKLYRNALTQEFGCRVCLNLEYASRRFKGIQMRTN